MSWSRIVNQRAAVQLLRRAFRSERVAHAYLFHGPDGVGKRAVALAFAQALQCQEGGAEPCTECSRCRKVQRLVHPDVHLLAPQTSDARPADIAAQRERLAAHPYAAADAALGTSRSVASNKQVYYHIGRIKEELRQAVGLHAVEGGYKIVIMTRAETMRVEAANALLKLLEEPTPKTVFVLTTSRPDLLLATIVSRCQRVAFSMLTRRDIEAALRERDGIDAAEAATYAALADGSYTRALDLSRNPDLHEDRALLLDFLRQSYARRVDNQTALIDNMTRLGRERLKNVLSLALSWVRDLVLYQHADSEAILVNVDQAESVARFTRNIPHADLPAMTRLLEEAMVLVAANANVRLVLTTLSLALGHAMRGRRGGRLFVPLAEESFP